MEQCHSPQSKYEKAACGISSIKTDQFSILTKNSSHEIRESVNSFHVIYFYMILTEIDGWGAVVNTLNFLVPSGIVFGTAYYLHNKLVSEQHKICLLELKKEHIHALTPLKLLADECLTLFLDRISPNNIVIRLSKSGKSATQLRHELVQTILSEYNHNFSQEIYIYNNTWQMIRAIKDQIIGTEEDCYTPCGTSDSGPDLGKKILRTMAIYAPVKQTAIELLKKEIEIVL